MVTNWDLDTERVWFVSGAELNNYAYYLSETLYIHKPGTEVVPFDICRILKFSFFPFPWLQSWTSTQRGCVSFQNSITMHDIFHLRPYMFCDQCGTGGICHLSDDSCLCGLMYSLKFNLWYTVNN